MRIAPAAPTPRPKRSPVHHPRRLHIDALVPADQVGGVAQPRQQAALAGAGGGAEWGGCTRAKGAGMISLRHPPHTQAPPPRLEPTPA